jgi:hypothetical protein
VLATLVTVALTGCETTAEKSAKLERLAKTHEGQSARKRAAAQRLLTITRPSRLIKVAGVTLLHSSEGLAAVVTLQNKSAKALGAVPVRITVRDRAGKSLYTNEQPGQAAALISASLIPAHGRLQWIDDQIPANGSAAGVTAEVGEGTIEAHPAPAVSITGAHMTEDPTSGPGAEGEVVTHSSVTQTELVVYATARRAGRIVAAGRAVLPQAASGAATRFQLFFIGDPDGAQLEVTAPPSTLG